jgi:hypothetical protein
MKPLRKSVKSPESLRVWQPDILKFLKRILGAHDKIIRLSRYKLLYLVNFGARRVWFEDNENIGSLDRL